VVGFPQTLDLPKPIFWVGSDKFRGTREVHSTDGSVETATGFNSRKDRGKGSRLHKAGATLDYSKEENGFF